MPTVLILYNRKSRIRVKSKHAWRIQADKLFPLSASACNYCIDAYMCVNQNLVYFIYRNTKFPCISLPVFLSPVLHISKNGNGLQPHNIVVQPQHNQIKSVISDNITGLSSNVLLQFRKLLFFSPCSCQLLLP